jgi:hypothetical protein
VKLRIHGNSLRLRLSRTDVDRLQQTGICSESVRFGPGSQLNYRLEASSDVSAVEARYGEEGIRILAPRELVRAWAESEEVSLSAGSGAANGLSLLIEKDFQCLHRDEANVNTNADAFPNPLASGVRS